MKLKFDVEDRSQPDPYIFADNGKYYLYVTAGAGVEAYSADDVFGTWHFEGIVCRREGHHGYWAPCIIKIDGMYYLYFSCEADNASGNILPTQCLCVAKSSSPLGPFGDIKQLFNEFSIDAHVVENESGLYLFFAKDNYNDISGRIGTRVYVIKLADPYTPEGEAVECIRPTMDEEIFTRNRLGDGRNWHTIEGAFSFRDGDYEYVIYSGACFMNDTYHLGYVSAKTDEKDLRKISYTKHLSPDGKFDPLMIKNDVEEGCGHNSVIKLGDTWYIVYHARDYDFKPDGKHDGRTARIRPMKAENGVLTAEGK